MKTIPCCAPFFPPWYPAVLFVSPTWYLAMLCARALPRTPTSCSQQNSLDPQFRLTLVHWTPPSLLAAGSRLCVTPVFVLAPAARRSPRTPSVYLTGHLTLIALSHSRTSACAFPHATRTPVSSAPAIAPAGSPASFARFNLLGYPTHVTRLDVGPPARFADLLSRRDPTLSQPVPRSLGYHPFYSQPHPAFESCHITPLGSPLS